MSTRQKPRPPKETIKEIVVVEGRSDTHKLKKLFDVETIETNGSDLTERKLSLIEKAALARGVILFLDPDHQGDRIRKKIASRLAAYKECFVRRSDFAPGAKKTGIAEASDAAIARALGDCVSNDAAKASLGWNEYLSFGLGTKAKRLAVCDALNIAYCNHKQLFRKLNLMGINKERLGAIVDGRTE